MEFLRKLKKREFIEMALKTIIAVLAGIIIIFLMEGMIFNIHMDTIHKNGSTASFEVDRVVYYEQQKNGLYTVYLRQPGADNGKYSWFYFTNQTDPHNTYIECDNPATAVAAGKAQVKKMINHLPTAFDVSITGGHYACWIVFELLIGGFYTWRFFMINKEYNAYEKKLLKTGKIF